MVDRPHAELDRELYRADLRKLVSVHTQDEPRRAAREQVAACLFHVERAVLDEDVGRDRELRRVREDLGDRPVDVRVGIRVLRRDGMRTEPRRDAAGRGDRGQLGQLCVVVEAVAALALERRGAVREHRVPVARDDRLELDRPGGAGRAGRREDSASRRQQLLVRRSAGAKRELVCAVAGESRVGMAVDETGDRRPPTPVDLLDVTVEPRQRTHRADGLDLAVADEDVRVFHDLDGAELSPAKQRPPQPAWRAGRGRGRGGGSRSPQGSRARRHAPESRRDSR